jgi:methionyl aminopeptidase
MIELKSSGQLDGIRKSSRILVDVLAGIKNMVKPGVSTGSLDEWVRKQIIAANARCAFLGYKGFPKAICVSVNEEIVHGIPGERILREGDIASIDIGVEHNGYFSDAAITVAVGRASDKADKLVDVTRKALSEAIECAVLGARISDISCAIEECAKKNNFSVIREFVGHGIGLNLHEDPQIPNFGQPGMGVRLKEGMVLAIEPMICAGKPDIEILSDGWTAVTMDRSLSAHFEHTIAITGQGPEILTDGI